MGDLYFSLGVRLTHFFNLLLLTLLVRSGIEIISAHPKLYWHDDALPGSEWLRLTRKPLPQDGSWTAEDEATTLSPWVAMPGKGNLGLGRHWHFGAATGWMLTGIVYLIVLVTTPQWQRLVPTSWSILPDAWQTLLIYLQFALPPEGHPYNPLQQLSYFAIVLIVAPLQIITGVMMSPALAGRFPWLPRLLGGHQAARSLHFIGLVVFVAFTIVHVGLVVAHGFGPGMARIVLGDTSYSQPLAVTIGVLGLALVAGFNVWGTRSSLRHPMRTKQLLEIGIDPLRRRLFHGWVSRQDHRHISAYARINGRPPRNDAYQRLIETDFDGFRLEVDGLVEAPQSLSLAELGQLPRTTVRSLHVCIQGWTYVAQWGGVPVSALLVRCRPLPTARYLVFWTLDDKWEYSPHGPYRPVENGYYYETIDMNLAMMPQTILADEMNGERLPIAHGAPLRLRVENQLGYKMAKWVHRIEVVADIAPIGRGQGGWRDDVLHYYPSDAGI